MTTDKDLERWKGKLKGKIVLAMPIREVKASFDPLATRYTDEESEEAARRSIRLPRRRRNTTASLLRLHGQAPAVPRRRGRRWPCSSRAAAATAGRSSCSRAASTARTRRSRSSATPSTLPTQVVLAVEHYNRIARMLDKNVPGLDRAERQEHDDAEPDGVQRHRGDARHGQGRRGRDARRALRLVAQRHGRDRQRRRARP